MALFDLLLDLEKTPLARDYAAGEYNLDGFRAFVESLGSPQLGLVFIHIAGTKGKGSTAAFCEGLLRGLGYPTALFSSPHLTHYGERFRFDGVPWTFDEFRAALDRFEGALDPGQRMAFEGPKPWRTVFEVLTALALVEFRRASDAAAARNPGGLPLVVCWETGLGGRLDCTNIVDPAVAVITRLAMDHMKILGDTVELIAGEKAGIIKQGRPAVIARQAPAFHDRVWPVLTGRCATVGAPLVRAWEHNPVVPLADGRARVTLPNGAEVDVAMPLAGAFQRDNLEAAIAAVWQVHRLYSRNPAGFHLGGLPLVDWPGRYERHVHPATGATVLLDGAHCPHSAAVIAAAVAEHATPVTLLMGMQRDKDVRGFLEGFLRGLGTVPLRRLYVYTVPGPRGATGDELASVARGLGIPVLVAPDAAAALDQAIAAGDRLILSAGTLYTIGSLRAAIQSASQRPSRSDSDTAPGS